MNWTLDTRIEPTEPAEPRYLPTLSGRRAMQPHIEATEAVLALSSTVCECGATATVEYFSRWFCQPCVDFMEHQRRQHDIRRFAEQLEQTYDDRP